MTIIDKKEIFDFYSHFLGRILQNKDKKKMSKYLLIVGEKGVGKKQFAENFFEDIGGNIDNFIIYPISKTINDIKNIENYIHNSIDKVLFIKNIDFLPESSQIKILKSLQAKNIRFIASSCQNLPHLEKIAPIIQIPPLRKRIEDMPFLVKNYSQKYSPIKNYTKGAILAMQKYRWPQNLSELESFISQMSQIKNTDDITASIIKSALPEILPKNKIVEDEDENKNRNAKGLGEIVDRSLKAYFDAHGEEIPAEGLYQRIHDIIDRPLIIRALAATGGNQIKAAELLGLNRNTLRKKMKLLDIKPKK